MHKSSVNFKGHSIIGNLIRTTGGKNLNQGDDEGDTIAFQPNPKYDLKAEFLLPFKQLKSPLDNVIGE